MKIPKQMRVARPVSSKVHSAKWAPRAVRPSGFCPCQLLSEPAKSLCCAALGCC